jgi:hypothetical protein
MTEPCRRPSRDGLRDRAVTELGERGGATGSSTRTQPTCRSRKWDDSDGRSLVSVCWTESGRRRITLLLVKTPGVPSYSSIHVENLSGVAREGGRRLRPAHRSGLFSIPPVVVPVVFASWNSGAATCAANTSVTVRGGTVTCTVLDE